MICPCFSLTGESLCGNIDQYTFKVEVNMPPSGRERKCSKEKDTDSLSNGSKRICIPIEREEYEQILLDKTAFRQYLDMKIEQYPELFPSSVCEGFQGSVEPREQCVHLGSFAPRTRLRSGQAPAGWWLQSAVASGASSIAAIRTSSSRRYAQTIFAMKAVNH